MPDMLQQVSVKILSATTPQILDIHDKIFQPIFLKQYAKEPTVVEKLFVHAIPQVTE